MGTYVYALLSKATVKNKKYKVELYDKDKQRIKTVQFGDSRYSDFTTNHNEIMRKSYIARHNNSREDWTRADTPASCSRWILWHSRSLSEGFDHYLERFNLKKLS